MRFDTDSDQPDAEASLNLTRELHAHLVTVLAEKFGDALTVQDAEDPENGLVGYRFEIHGAVCSAGFAPIDGNAAVLSLNGWLGRIHHIRLWFPQFIDASAIAEFEADENEGMAFALRSPQEALEAFEGSEKIQQDNPILYCYVTRWLGEWEKNLEMNNSPQIKALEEENPEFRAALPIARLRALRALGRHEEVMTLLPSLPEEQLAKPMNAAIHAECLCGLGQDEEALELIQSAELDEQPWIHFIRSLACVKLKKFVEAAEHLRIYEILIGPDALAHKTLTELLPDNEEDGSEE